MKLTDYFIRHPVIAIILNGMIIVAGLLCYKNLSLREYPDISFPIINVSVSWPNASPELVESSITNLLEDQLAGLEGLETISSESYVGHSNIVLIFRGGTSMARALNATQDAVGIARALLPRDIKTPEVKRQKQASGLPFIAISLESDSREFGDLTHYANLNLKNAFRSLPGVASVEVYGLPYTYKINLDPAKLYAFGVNADEVVTAITKSQVSLPVGKYRNKIPSTMHSELRTQKDYEDLLIKMNNNNNPVFLKSVAEIVLETDKNKSRVHVNGNTGLILDINRAEDANPLEVSREVHAIVDQFQQGLPSDMRISIMMDQSDFIHASIKNIRSSIIEAIVLVLLIVFLFLRNIRAMFIPLITIPVSLTGSLIFLKIFGFSLNLMTLLAAVLAIGLVVDDAIIVLENIWRHIEKGLAPLQAALTGARETGFAIIAMTFTLISVYLPIAFIQGTLGQLFIEFAVALAGSVLVSGVVALTLSPLMCAKLLNRNTENHWQKFDVFMHKLTEKYSRSLTWIIQKRTLTLGIALFSICSSIVLYQLLGKETAPREDRGLVGIFTASVAGDNIDTMEHKVKNLDKIVHALPEAKNHLAFIGDWGSNIVIPLQPHIQRHRSAETIVNELKPLLNEYPSVDPHVWSWDSGLPGLDDAGRGQELTMVLSSTDDYRTLFNTSEKLKKRLEKSGKFASVSHDLRLDTMGYNIEINHNQLAKLGLSPSQVAKTIEVFFSGDKSQTFEKDGVIYAINIRGNTMPWTLDELYLTTPKGKKVSLGAVATMQFKAQPAILNHTRQMHSVTFSAQIQKGRSLEKSMSAMEDITRTQLPPGYKYTWTGAAKSLHESSHTMIFLLLLSLLFIYAILAAQFENFIDPLVILFTVPLACIGALLFTWLFDQTLNIYTQVGLITLIGLISKHGILIVEFANQLRQRGLPISDAVIQASILRLRPVLMTTAAMVFGAIPLLLTHDAGAESRHAIGTVLIGGLSLGTLFTLFILPGIYLIIKGWNESKRSIEFQDLH